MNKRKDDDDQRVIVSPKAYDEQGRETYHVAGATQERCNKCQDAIWIAPSSRAMMNDGGPEFELLCINCLFIHYADQLPDSQFAAAPGAAQELVDYARRINDQIQELKALRQEYES